MDINFEDLKNFGKGINIQPISKTPDKQEEEMFCSIIERVTELFKRTQMITEYGIDLTEYENDFFCLIEDMIFAKYGPLKAEVIFFWIYEVPGVEKNTPIFLIDNNGEKTQIKTTKQLYKYLKRIE